MADNKLKLENDASLYHLPPQSIEAEESLLSAILIDNRTLFDILDILSPAIFTDRLIKRFFRRSPSFFTQ